MGCMWMEGDFTRQMTTKGGVGRMSGDHCRQLKLCRTSRGVNTDREGSTKGPEREPQRHSKLKRDVLLLVCFFSFPGVGEKKRSGEW